MSTSKPKTASNKSASAGHVQRAAPTLWSRLSVRQSLFLIALCFGSVLFVILLAGKSHLRHRVHEPSTSYDSSEEIRSSLFSSISPERLVQNLRSLTEEPHVAGTDANRRVAEKLARIWRESGLEDVHLISYDVLLSYPNFSSPNHLSVIGADGSRLFETSGLSPALLSENEQDYRASIQWLAYSANGVAEGEAVYCHYGRPEDFERLEREFNISSLEGKIAILRYDVDFRGDKVRHAEQRGAIGAVLYSDPAEVAKDGMDGGHTFPNEVWLPSVGVQRGSVQIGNGDPQTPLLPSRRDFHRQISVDQGSNTSGGAAPPSSVRKQCCSGHTFPNEVWLPSVGVQRGTLMPLKGDPLSPLLPSRPDMFAGRTVEQARREHLLPSIPVLPLSFGDASRVLSRLDGPAAPSDWQGGLNFTYRLGPSLRPGEGAKLRLEVQSSMEVRTINDVVGYIKGSEQPDQWVMLGNHFDAWVFGSIDPNSGSTILAEVARAFAETVHTKGWRPKRTLVFCAWDAEEHGLIGSTEFVQEFADVLQERAVVYLNVDLISNNQSLDVRTVPSLYSAVTAAARAVPSPLESERAAGRPTMYDTWRHYFPPQSSWLPDTPQMELPGGGSDHMSFLNFLGIPVVDFTYRNASWLSYPLYHSRYELPFVNEHLFDNDNMAVHKAVGQYWAELARSFADSPLLPVNASLFAQKLLADYVSEVKTSIMALHERFPNETRPAVRQLANLVQNVRQFIGQAETFERRIAEGEVDAEWANRRLRKLDQCFVNPALGLAEREPEKRHVLFSLSADNSYSATVMAAVQAKIAQLAHAKTPKARTEAGEQLALELSVVQFSVLCAVRTLAAFI